MSNKRGSSGHGQSTRKIPPADIAKRVQAFAWFASVIARAQCSREDLQKDYVTYDRGVDSSETFSRIEHVGLDPGSKKTFLRKRKDHPFDIDLKLRGLTLVQRVAASKKLAPTCDLYESKLWKLLTPPRPHPEALAKIIGELLDSLRFTRDPFHQTRRKRVRYRGGNYFVVPGVSRKYLDGLESVASIGSADSLALLAALYLEASDHGAFNSRPLALAVFRGEQNFSINNRILGIADSLVRGVLTQRILQGRWGELTTSEQLDNAEQFIVRRREALAVQGDLTESQMRRTISYFALEKVALLRPTINNYLIYAPLVRLNTRGRKKRAPNSGSSSSDEQERLRRLIKQDGPFMESIDEEISRMLMAHILGSKADAYWELNIP